MKYFYKMEKYLRCFILVLVVFSSLSSVNANFVCGEVESSEIMSPAWMEVSVYYEEQPSNILFCPINSQNKFCCDLEEISSVNWEVGKNVFAELFDEETGYVAGPVQLTTTEESYDLFPSMNLSKAINISSSKPSIFLRDDKIILNISLNRDYSSLRYTLTNSQGAIGNPICSDCSSANLELSALKGKNQIVILASDGGRDIFETLDFYYLDYLNLNTSFECDKCFLKKKWFAIPSNSNVTANFFINASHNVSGILTAYVPLSWDSESSIDYSESHYELNWNITYKKEFFVTENLQAPSGWKNKRFLFKLNFEENSLDTKVFVYNIFRFHSPTIFWKRFFKNKYSFDNNFKKISPENPLVIKSESPYVDLVAIYPKKEMIMPSASLKYDEKKRLKKRMLDLEIISDFANKDIENILLKFKIPSGKKVKLYSGRNEMDLTESSKAEEYTYYEARLSKKEKLRLEISK